MGSLGPRDDSIEYLPDVSKQVCKVYVCNVIDIFCDFFFKLSPSKTTGVEMDNTGNVYIFTM